MTQRIPLVFLYLAVTEALIFASTVFIAAYSRNYIVGDVPGWAKLADIERITGPLFSSAAVFSLVMLIAMVAMGLYNMSYLKLGRHGVGIRMISAHVFGTLIFTFLVYLIPALFLGRGILLMSVGLSLIFVLIERKAFSELIYSDVVRRRILVYGSGSRAKSIETIEEQLSQHGVTLCGFVRVNKEPVYVSSAHVMDNYEPVPDLANRLDIDEIIVAADDRRNALMIDELLECRLSGVSVTELASFFESESGILRLDVMPPSAIIFSHGFDQNEFKNALERVFDLFGSVLLLLFTWPVMLITAIMIKIEDGWKAPVLYHQTRIGIQGKPFSVLKFRSMREDAEKHTGAKWAVDNDDRITRVGYFIRKLRIDELPQIINVFRGEMSFVGPRPERPEFVRELVKKLPYYSERHRVKPGITGWAQLNYPYGASDRDAMEKLQYDMYYAKNHSLLLDLFILIQTVEVVLFGKGAR